MDEGKGPNPYFEGLHEGESDELRALRLALVKERDELRAELDALREQEPAVACADPMCACRGGPCAACQEGEREKELEDLRGDLAFYKRRSDALQVAQRTMRDPERTMVCDILANGFLLEPAGKRYDVPAQPVKRLSADEIRAVFLSHGFEIKPGFDDLKPYVYVTARAVETALAAAWGVKLED